jgi:hypothetical protein
MMVAKERVRINRRLKRRKYGQNLKIFSSLSIRGGTR